MTKQQIIIVFENVRIYGILVNFLCSPFYYMFVVLEENYVIKIGKFNWGLVDKHNLVVCYSAPPDVFVA